ncbi:MAG: DUF3857 domain-containing protein [Candidatus Omnitrophica bacterium]|nr:DUF3857 domain-containing protein [Candidatus Omnitrophota bacterium]
MRKYIVLTAFTLGIGCGTAAHDVTDLYRKTYAAYEARLKKTPQDETLRQEFAGFCYEFREYDKVKEILKTPETTAEKVVLAKALTKNKEFTHALEIFNQIRNEIKDPEALFLYGQVLEEQNLYPQAVKIYEKVSGSFKEKARERLVRIKAQTGEETPGYIDELLKAASPFIAEVKNEAVIILSVDEETEITDRNTSVSTVHVIEMVLNERGKKAAEVQIGYDSTYERVELEFARTINNKGEMVYVGEENIRDVSRYLNYPLYSNARARIISMPSVDVGAIIEYKVKVFSGKLMNDKDFSFLYRVREASPVFKADFRLTIPENNPVQVKFFNTQYAQDVDLKPHIEKKPGRLVYSWNFQKIMPIIPEEHMPPFSFVNPAILVSSFNDWDEIYRWWYGLYKDKLALSEEIKGIITDLTKDEKSEYRKAKAIAEYVAKNIRYVAVEYGDSGYEPHAATEVFLNRYGDCKDQAILLVAMLDAAGFNAYPVLIPTEDAYPIAEDFPSVIFNHAIAAVKINNELIFMDPTAETTSFADLPVGDQNRDVLVFSDDGYFITKTPELNNSRAAYTMDIDLDENENAFIKRVVTTAGAYTAYHRWYLKYTHPQTIKEDIESKMVKISSFSKLIDYEIKDVDNFDASPQLEYSFTTEKFLNPAKDLRVVPVLNEIDLQPSLIAKERRDFPVDLLGLFTKEARVSIALPQNLRIKYLPGNIDVRTKWFDFFLSYTQGRNSLDFSQKFVIKRRFVSQDDYEEFKERLKDVFYFLREEIILEKTKG